jgi:hypothetical protein
MTKFLKKNRLIFGYINEIYLPAIVSITCTKDTESELERETAGLLVGVPGNWNASDVIIKVAFDPLVTKVALPVSVPLKTTLKES